MKTGFQKAGLFFMVGVLAISASACSQKKDDESSGEVKQESIKQEAEKSETTNEEISNTESDEQKEVVSETFNDVPVKEVDASESDSDYYQKLWESEVYNYKLIRNIPTAYENESWENYCSVANILTKTENPENLTDTEKELIEKAQKVRKSLVQTKSIEDSIWYLWNNDMPMAEDASELKFTVESYDNSDFKPFLVPYLLEDQSEVKGNMIIIAGGGYSSRGNSGEGYPVAEAFEELGYNCYVLQRRVAPYSEDDIWMDMQRSIRLVRSKIDELKLGGEDCIAASGFSGGSGTILGAIAKYYGDVQPVITDDTYTPDAIDAYSADLTVACTMYGPNYASIQDYQGLVTENENLPAFFIGGGADDDLTYADDFKLAASVKGKAPAVEIHTFANVGHGFGVGITGTNSILWTQLADGFMQQVVSGGKIISASAEVEIPEEYTKKQTYTVKMGFGDADITYVANEDESKFYIYFTAFEDTQILEGTITDGVVTVTYDKTGFMSGDAQMIIDNADKNAWELIQ